MINSQSSRRNFLGSLAILSAGTALGSVKGFVPEPPVADLQKEWKQFCRQNNGQVSGVDLPTAPALEACKGHWCESGEVVAFSQHNLLAQPIWVYWSEDKKKPADMIITLYNNDAAKTKLARLNRFEWEALQALPVDGEQQDVIALMKETGKPQASAKQGNTAAMKVRIRKGKNINITARLNQQDITINRQFLYSI